MKTKSSLNIDWLWDRNIPKGSLLKILENPVHPQFHSLSALLLSRKNSPREVFSNYLNPREFRNHWNTIKREMRKNRWNDPRIIFWQAVYESLAEKYPKKKLAEPAVPSRENMHLSLSKTLGEKIKALRKTKGLTQHHLAKKLHVSQQRISHIESGRENLSLLTLQKVADHLDAKIIIDVSREKR